tara:strand:- start:4270 stop:4752 length:483 start_codon:yes stop_codon:yes gene_type:complete
MPFNHLEQKIDISQLLWLVLSVSLILFCKNLYAKNFGDAEVSQILSVYDGDTFRADIKNWPAVVGKNISIRLNGTDTPEISGKCSEEKEAAKKAKNFVRRQFQNAKIIYLKNIKRGKYFRVVADVYIDGKSLRKMLEDRNLSVPYEGGRKIHSWCSQTNH